MIEFPFLGKSLQKYKDVIENEFELNIHILQLNVVTFHQLIIVNRQEECGRVM